MSSAISLFFVHVFCFREFLSVDFFLQALTGLSHLRGQITHQEKRNNDLFAFNVTLRKLNSELTAQLEELKSKNEELMTNQAALVEKNAELISQMDGVRDELESEKAVSAGLKSELEAAVLKVQIIAVDAVLSVRVELMGEFKRGDH